MKVTIYGNKRWAALTFGTALLWLAACKGDDCIQEDTERPKLVVTSPKEGQAFRNGDTIRIEAVVTDNGLLHEYIWGILEDTLVVVPDTIAYAHEKMEQAISGFHVVGGVSAPALWTVTIHADDERHNADEKKISVVVSQ